MMNGGVGVEVECAGSVVGMLSGRERLVSEGVERMEKILSLTTYRGPVFLLSSVTESYLTGVGMVVGLLPGMTYPGMELIRDGSTSQLLHRVASGMDVTLPYHFGYSIGVTVTVPPWPTHPGPIGVGVSGLNGDCFHHVWPRCVMVGQGVAGQGGMETAGGDGMVATVTARGSSIREAQRRVYRTISHMRVPDAQYRTDIGERVRRRDVYDEWLHKTIPIGGEEAKLRRWGWI